MRPRAGAAESRASRVDALFDVENSALTRRFDAAETLAQRQFEISAKQRAGSQASDARSSSQQDDELSEEALAAALEDAFLPMA